MENLVLKQMMFYTSGMFMYFKTRHTLPSKQYLLFLLLEDSFWSTLSGGDGDREILDKIPMLKMHLFAGKAKVILEVVAKHDDYQCLDFLSDFIWALAPLLSSNDTGHPIFSLECTKLITSSVALYLPWNVHALLVFLFFPDWLLLILQVS